MYFIQTFTLRLLPSKNVNREEVNHSLLTYDTANGFKLTSTDKSYLLPWCIHIQTLKMLWTVSFGRLAILYPLYHEKPHISPEIFKRHRTDAACRPPTTLRTAFQLPCRNKQPKYCMFWPSVCTLTQIDCPNRDTLHTAFTSRVQIALMRRLTALLWWPYTSRFKEKARPD